MHNPGDDAPRYTDSSCINLSSDSDVVLTDVSLEYRVEETILLSSDDDKPPDMLCLQHRDSTVFEDSLDESEPIRDADIDQASGLNISLPFVCNKDDPIGISDLEELGAVAIHSPAKRTFPSRVIKEVPFPAGYMLKVADIFDKNTGLPRLEILKEHLQQGGRIQEIAALRIIDEGADVVLREKNLIEVDASVIICTNINGKFYDLMKLFEISGPPDSTNYIILGDFMDTDCFSMECIIYLWSLKICYPKTFFLLRENHKCRNPTHYSMFKQECLLKYSETVYNKCMIAFDYLPLAAMIGNYFFCSRTGLSPESLNLNGANIINFEPTNSEIIDRSSIFNKTSEKNKKENTGGDCIKDTSVMSLSSIFQFIQNCSDSATPEEMIDKLLDMNKKRRRSEEEK